MNLKGRKHLFTSEDCIPQSSMQDYTNQIVVISEHSVTNFHPDYQSCDNQLFHATGGFGCSPNTMGSAVFGRFLNDGEQCRMERGQFIGILKPELVEEYEIEVPVHE